MSKIFIVGYYGWDLVGDDCILDGIISSLKDKKKDLEFIVSSQDPDKTEKLFPVKAIFWNNIKELIQNIKECDMVVVGGGGIFNEYVPWKHNEILTKDSDFNVFCASIPILAICYEKPCMLYSIGVEPLYSDFAKRDVKLAVTLADFTCVRDNGSKEILKQIGVEPENVEVFADPAYLIPIPTKKRTKELQDNSLLVGVSIRDWIVNNRFQWEKELTHGLDLFADKHNCKFVFLPFQQSPEFGKFGDDLDIMNRVRENMKNKDKVKIIQIDYDHRYITQLISQCEIFVGMRYHSIILSTLFSIPCVGINYSLKIRSIIERAGLLDYSINLKSFTRKDLFLAMENCLSNKDELRNKLEEFSKEMKNKAEAAAEIVTQFLNKEKSGIKHSSIVYDIINILMQKVGFSLNQNEYYQILKKHVRMLIDTYKEYSYAEQVLKQLLEINPTDAECNYLYAYSLHQQSKDLHESLNHYNNALKYGFNEFWVRYQRGLLQATFGRTNLAIKDLKLAYDLNPSDDVKRALSEINKKSNFLFRS